jgi:hypothetical protein
MFRNSTSHRAGSRWSASLVLALVAFGNLALATPSAPAQTTTSIDAPAANKIVAQEFAAQGYDVVAYFFNARPRRGIDHLTHVHDGQVYRFINETNLQAFKANPAKYAPAYGGNSAQAMAAGRKVPGDPRYWTIVDRRLYLNHDAAGHAEWAVDPEAYIAFANTQWHWLRGNQVSALPLPTR